MDEIIRDVRDIDRVDRQALEHVIGQSLHENQKVVINVVDTEVPSAPGQGRAFTEETRPGAQPRDEQVPEWWNIYEGLSDEEVDRLDGAIRERANLTRHFE